MTPEAWDEEIARLRMRERDDKRYSIRVIVEAALILLFIFAAASAKGADDVEIVTSPRNFVMWNRHAAVRVWVRVPYHQANDGVHLCWDKPYPGDGGCSYFQLDEKVRGSFSRIIADLVPGTMRITATLHRGKYTARFERLFEVVGGE